VKVIKKTKEFTIYQKSSGRYGVRGVDKKWINAEEKVKILLGEGLIKPSSPRESEVPIDASSTPEETPTT
jgi:hypothetical protein